MACRLKQRRPGVERRNLAHTDGHNNKVVVELLGCLNPSPVGIHHHQGLLDLLDLREPLHDQHHDQHHDQTVPKPAVLGADDAQQTSIA